jgi:hypothetical protein
MNDAEAREQGLQLAVAWGSALCESPGAVVEAAERFAEFLRADGGGQFKPAAVEPRWSDGGWRVLFLGDLLDAIKERLTWQVNAESIGGVLDIDESERALAKGVHGLNCHWLAQTSEAHAVDSMVSDHAVFELPRVKIEATFDRPEEEMAADLAAGSYEAVRDRVADAAATKINADIKDALQALLAAAGVGTSLSSNPDEWWACPPFRVVTAHFGGLKAKEWISEVDDRWHLTVKLQIGAAAFVPALHVVDA